MRATGFFLGAGFLFGAAVFLGAGFLLGAAAPPTAGTNDLARGFSLGLGLNTLASGLSPNSFVLSDSVRFRTSAAPSTTTWPDHLRSNAFAALSRSPSSRPYRCSVAWSPALCSHAYRSSPCPFPPSVISIRLLP